MGDFGKSLGSQSSSLKNSVSVGEGKKKSQEDAVKDSLKVAAAVAGVAVLGWGLYRLFSSSSSSIVDVGERVLVKAPGREDSYIFRDEFELNPAAYFQNSRNKDF